MTTTTFDLRSLVRDVLAESDEPDPSVVARSVFALIPSDEYGNVIATLLPNFVRNVANMQGRSGASFDATKRTNDPQQCRRARSIRSRRVALSIDGNAWKFLDACNVDDLLAAASIRHHMAETNRAEATRYERLAEKLKTYRCDTVADLDDALFVEAWR